MREPIETTRSKSAIPARSLLHFFVFFVCFVVAQLLPAPS